MKNKNLSNYLNSQPPLADPNMNTSDKMKSCINDLKKMVNFNRGKRDTSTDPIKDVAVTTAAAVGKKINKHPNVGSGGAGNKDFIKDMI